MKGAGGDFPAILHVKICSDSPHFQLFVIFVFQATLPFPTHLPSTLVCICFKGSCGPIDAMIRGPDS